MLRAAQTLAPVEIPALTPSVSKSVLAVSMAFGVGTMINQLIAFPSTDYAVHTIQNQETGEELYVMKLDVNELEFDVCVPVKGVFGEPAQGRRFKANMWLQGRINF